MILSNIEDELIDRLIPAVAQILISLQQIRAQVRAKEEMASSQAFGQINTLGISTQKHV